MEMLAASRSIAQAPTQAHAGAAAALRVSETEVDAASEQTFLQHIALSNVTNAVPFTLIAICSVYLPGWRIMAGLLVLNVAAMAAMYLVSRRIAAAQDGPHYRAGWRVYEGLAFLTGVLWSGLMLPIMPTLGHDIASAFVCVVIIVAVAITSMVLAPQWRSFVCFLSGVMLCLVPQTVAFIGVLGLIPLAATLGLVPALGGLALALRRQHRLMIRTQLENRRLADDLTHALAAAEYLASRDSLTGLYNRRAFEELARKAAAEAHAEPLCLILVDLDHFKAINDCHGHGIGDSVLQQAGQLIAGVAGPRDLVGRGDGAVARWGGEEFILLLRGCTPDGGALLAERLRVGLSALGHAEWPEGLRVTGSFGVAAWHGRMPLHLGISRADAAMYEAKNAGRDRVCIHSEAMVEA